MVKDAGSRDGDAVPCVERPCSQIRDHRLEFPKDDRTKNNRTDCHRVASLENTSRSANKAVTQTAFHPDEEFLKGPASGSGAVCSVQPIQLAAFGSNLQYQRTANLVTCSGSSVSIERLHIRKGRERKERAFILLAKLDPEERNSYLRYDDKF